MKKIVMASAMMAATAMAGSFESRPEASVPTPVEARESFDKVPNMSEKENMDWQRLREERRAAREQILENLRNKTAGEKNEMRDVAVKPAAPKTPNEKKVEKSNGELIQEKKMEEKELPKGPFVKPFGPDRMEPRRPIVPRPIEGHPWKNQNPRDWKKGPIQRK